MFKNEARGLSYDFFAAHGKRSMASKDTAWMMVQWIVDRQADDNGAVALVSFGVRCKKQRDNCVCL